MYFFFKYLSVCVTQNIDAKFKTGAFSCTEKSLSFTGPLAFPSRELMEFVFNIPRAQFSMSVISLARFWPAATDSARLARAQSKLFRIAITDQLPLPEFVIACWDAFPTGAKPELKTIQKIKERTLRDLPRLFCKKNFLFLLSC